MANSDSIAPIIQALSVLVAPNPALDPNNPQVASKWTDGSSAANPGTLYVPVQTVLGVLFGASQDLAAVGNGVNSALTQVSSFVGTIADELSNLPAVEEAINVFSALQTVLNLAEALSSGSTGGVLQSASGLFKQLQSLMLTVTLAEAELGELSQQLKAAAPLFPKS